MEKVIEKLLKEKIGTAFSHKEIDGSKVFILQGYGRGVLITYDIEIRDLKMTNIIYPQMKRFIVDIQQDQPHFEMFFVTAVKMMIEMRKKVEANADAK